jgi:hypothetical protein
MPRVFRLLAIAAVSAATLFTLSPLVVPVIAESPVKITVTPRVGTSPQDVHLKVIVERAPANRKLILDVDGPNYGRKTFWDLEGEQAQRVFDVWRQSLPCGNYTVTATVLRNDNTQAVARDTFRLVGFGCSDPDPY